VNPGARGFVKAPEAAGIVDGFGSEKAETLKTEKLKSDRTCEEAALVKAFLTKLIGKGHGCAF